MFLTLDLFVAAKLATPGIYSIPFPIITLDSSKVDISINGYLLIHQMFLNVGFQSLLF